MILDVFSQTLRSKFPSSWAQGMPRPYPEKASSPGMVVKGILAFCLSLLSTAPAHAEKSAIELRYGEDGGKYDSASIDYLFRSVWSKDMGSWKTFLHPALEFNHFRYSGSAGGPGSINALGGLGLFRISRGDGRIRPYGELGLGIALFSRDNLGTRSFSTQFQFSEHLGLGLEFNETWMVGWRFSHYSNANIERPNDGMSLNQLVLGVRF